MKSRLTAKSSTSDKSASNSRSNLNGLSKAQSSSHETGVSPPVAMKEEVTSTQKLFVLVLLVAQNAAVVIMTRYSRGVLEESYLASSVVLMTEVCKLVVSVTCISMGMGNSWLNSQRWPLQKKLWYLMKNAGFAWVPAACYFAQNMLQYTALENLPAPVYAVLAQMKIFSAAIFSFLILGKKLPYRQWRALFLLVAGGVLIENHTIEVHAQGMGANNTDPIKGTVALVTIITLSGLAGVFTQLLLQNRGGNRVANDRRDLSLWDRNFQLAGWSLVAGSVALFKDVKHLSEYGFFGGYTVNTWILIALWTSGGILVALTIKYTDVIVKGFASAISLVCISILGYLLLGDVLDLVFVVGAFVVIVATFNYNDKDKIPTSGQVGPPNREEEVVIVSKKDVDREDMMDPSEAKPLVSGRN